MKNNVLFLASKSPSRAMLLREVSIPFSVIHQDVDESLCEGTSSFSTLVTNIALHKMEHLVIEPGKQEGECRFILTADTMVKDADGRVQGKPIDREDAIKKIKKAREGSAACTAFCLDKKIWHEGVWSVQERIVRTVLVEYIFDVPDSWIDTYFACSPALGCAGAGAVEKFGGQFLRSVRGSYSALVGLPLVELREALEELNFFADESQ